MNIKTTILSLVALAAVTSCGTPTTIAYFQDMKPEQPSDLAYASVMRVKPEDKLSIVVNSKDAGLADMFNLPIVTHRIGNTQASSLSNSQYMSEYTVADDGCIDFPILGRMPVVGKSRSDIARMIKEELIGRSLVKDPVVTVEYSNLYFSVLGEVAKPGRYAIDRDKVTLLDAIGMAGDLTIFGERKNVTVIRDVDGHPTPYTVDLTRSWSLYSSPAYFLQQKDVVYVTPNETRQRQSTVNGNNVRSTSFWISLASLLTSIAVLICK